MEGEERTTTKGRKMGRESTGKRRALAGNLGGDITPSSMSWSSSSSSKSKKIWGRGGGVLAGGPR